MRVLRLPLVSELGNRVFFAVRDEDRIEPEAFASARLVRDPTCERSRAAELVALRRDRHELADVARPPPVALDPLERAEQPANLVAGCTAGRANSRTTAEPFDLETGVLAEHPGV